MTAPEEVDGQVDLFDDLDAPGQARATDPSTSQIAARLITAKAHTARVRLLEAFGQRGDLTDEQAAGAAGLSLSSEYATRCSELRRAGLVVETGATRLGVAGTPRLVSRITDSGLAVLRARQEAAA